MNVEPGEIVKVSHWRGVYRIKALHPGGSVSLFGPLDPATGRALGDARYRATLPDRLREVAAK